MAVASPKGRPGGRSSFGRKILAWTAWCVTLFWTWLLYNGQWTHVELVAAACGGAIGATAAEIARSRGMIRRLRFRRQHLRRLWGPLWEIFPQFGYVALEAIALPFRLRRGAFVADPAGGPAGSDDPLGRAERVFLTYVTTLSPNDYVVEVERERRLVLRHTLARERLTDLQ